MKNFTNAFIMVGALIFLSGMASGKRVDAHIIVNRYELPALVVGRGPTQSMMIRLNGSSKAGIGKRGAWGISDSAYQSFGIHDRTCRIQ